MRFGLTAYGTVYHMGLPAGSNRVRITAKEQIDMAEAYGLQGVEIPLDILAQSDPAEVAAYAKQKSMFINVATGGYDTAALAKALQMAKQAGAITLRTVVGGAKFGGDRRHMEGKWQPFLQQILSAFQEATEVAEATGINLAVENHQDLASEELLWLCETIGSKRFGITLDTGNPLATAEHPADFFRSVAPYVKNAHLKDYKIYWSEEGYRLVRCPLGQGVIDFPDLFQVMGEMNPDVTMSVEHGALEARHVRVLQEDFWTEYPPRTARQLTRLLRFVEDRARYKGDWRTPFELGQTPDEIAKYEMEEMDIAMAYLSNQIRKLEKRSESTLTQGG
ncbi:sugar phosphate isomerase/epimerase family protein [Paenibacillus montanisoli]|uniref:Sugar phosphate isomerase/epimerase n=1 Tax=Paenibacillus montanisoli TaxID=2081970 RepID=A0A328U7W0_9BACL|nr:sugar phosphate isomerase/epimerase family protein [Paenibacillus montanisoli]RAP78560.1 sugar phosphate isomerase/epimerase [Paenibacillus montanisoli]